MQSAFHDAINHSSVVLYLHYVWYLKMTKLNIAFFLIHLSVCDGHVEESRIEMEFYTTSCIYLKKKSRK